MSRRPDDDEVRQRATTALRRTLFVEAGAGTGKTTMLVDRVVGLVVSGEARMEQIAAITFTEAAAAELRDRLAQQFERRAGEESDDRAAQALAALDGAAVTTLHGFARKILAEQPFAVGLPPLFEVADASSSRVAFDERWERFVNFLLGSAAHRDLVVRALSCGMTWTNLRAAALACEENWDRLAAVPMDNAPPPPVEAAGVVTLLEAALRLGAECTVADDRLAQHLRTRTGAAIGSLRAAADEIDLLQILSGLPRLSAGKAGAKAGWNLAPDGRPYKEHVLALLEEADAERARITAATVEWCLARLFSLLVDFALRTAAERLGSGRLSFHDLLVLARQLLRDVPVARAELHERYTHVLIDEFQDTDPLQAELALYLAAGAAADGRDVDDWADLPVAPGRLFFVGDPKQSIYRFRRADIELFMKVRRRVVGDAEQLTTNFRSRPALVAWVNAVFGRIFGPGVAGRQPPYEPLVAFEDKGHDNPRGLAPVIVLGQEPVNGLADDVRRAQARDVVAAIATLHAERWEVGDPARPARFSDVAVLIRSRVGLPVLEDAFRAAGVPYRLESSSLVYESQEVRQLLAILRAVDDPTDTLSVVAALRSPGFGCGDDDLLRHRAAGGRWDTRAAAPLEGPVADALAVLSEFHERRWWHGVSALVSQVVADCDLMGAALADTRPREAWRRLRFLMDQARQFDESNGGDLRAFLRWVGHQQEDGARVVETILPESDDDAVRISTVHAAKGLEFPVTVLMGLQTASPSQRPPLLFGTGGPELSLRRTMETPGYEGALTFERDMERLEQLRLLYVAATRASDLLIVSVHRDTSRAVTLASTLLAHCAECPDLWSDGAGLLADGADGGTDSLPPTVIAPDDAGARQDFMARRAGMLEQAAIPRTIAATGVKRLAGASEGESDDGVPADPSPLRRGRAGTAVGRAVHGVLQMIDLTSGAHLVALAQAHAAAEGVSERAPEVGARVRAALESALVRRAVASGRFWREVYVGVPVGGRVLEGFVDLLFETPDGLVVVDYKTDRMEGDGSAIADRYRLQGASYAVAVQDALGREVAECSFLILGESGAIAAPIPDLAVAMSEVRTLLERPAQPSNP